MNQETSERQMDACNFRSRVREAVRRLGEIDPEPSQEVYYGQLLALMDRSMVFQLPDDGLSLGVMSGYDFSKLDLYGRLPFPVVALEFRMSGKLPVYRDAPVVTNRRFALALDLMTPEILSLVHTMFPGMIDEASGSLGGLVEHDGALDAFVLLPFDSMEGANADRLREVGFDFEQIWFPGWAGAVVPYRQTGSGSYLRSADIAEERLVAPGDVMDLVVKAFQFRTPEAEATNPVESTTDGVYQFSLDYAAELSAATAMIAALACNNIEIEKVMAPAKLNKARQSRGKPLIPDFHVLAIKPRAGSHAAAGSSLGARAPVRTHVRRGHTRRLESGPIWINSMVINPYGGNGVANKSYRVEPSPAPPGSRT